ncbi:recombination directionality factor [Streptomyces avermitilis]|uniref:recombination directionality factor n=1 Tax=Streptomyces avermitilis TaxID=33903 RepID=UPI003822B9AB
MALKIWNTDPDNKPKKQERRSFGDTIGTFSIGKSVKNEKTGNNDPMALDTFRLMTASPEVAQAVSELLGGAPEETDSPSEEFIEVVTTASTIQVVADGPGAYYSDLKQWVRGKLVHHCDGEVFLSHLSKPEKVGQPCECPELFAERKQAAKDEMGPKPAIEFTFRLAEDLDLGKFKLKTGAWTLAAVEHEIIEALEAINGETLVEIGLELVEFVISKGPKKGTPVSYYKPTITVLGAFADAIAD